MQRGAAGVHEHKHEHERRRLPRLPYTRSRTQAASCFLLISRTFSLMLHDRAIDDE